MKNIKKIVSAALLSFFIIGATGCSLVEKTPEAIKNTVLAKVGKVNITRGKLDERMKDFIGELKAQYGDEYLKNEEAEESYKSEAATYLDDLITEEILLQKAQEYNLVPDPSKIDEEINKELETVKNTYFDGDQKKMEEQIVGSGFTLEQLKENIKEQLTNQKDQVSMNRAYLHFIKDVKVTDDDAKSYYEENKDAAFTAKPGAVLSHILVETEEKAKEVRNKIESGSKFEDMAKEFSTDPGSKDNGGSYGYMAYDSQQFIPEFMEAAKQLKEGEVSQPVKSEYGFHLIRATNISNETKITPFDEVKEQIKESLLQQKQQQEFTTKLEEFKNELKVKKYEDRL